jgi:hypothetical protein
MNNIFCFECGNKHSYTYSKPKFCSGCGSAFGAVKSAPKKTSPSKAAFDDDDVIDEDDDSYDASDFSDAMRVPRLRSLAVEVESDYEGVSSFKLGSLFGSSSSESPRRKKSTQNFEDFIEKKRVQ